MTLLKKYLLVAKQHKVMKISLPVCLAISVLGISSISVNAMEKTSTEKINTASSLEEVISFNSLSRSNSIAADSVARNNFDDSHSINLSSTDQELSLENGVRTDYTQIWREGLGEPEKNSLQVTLVRF